MNKKMFQQECHDRKQKGPKTSEADPTSGCRNKNWRLRFDTFGTGGHYIYILYIYIDINNVCVLCFCSP